MKILYLNPTGVLGGAERSLLDLLRSVRLARPDWSLELLTGSEGDLNDATRLLGIAVHVKPMPGRVTRLGDAGAGGPAGNQVSTAQLMRRICLSAPQLAAYIWKLRGFIHGHKPDVIHSNGFKTHIAATWTAPAKTAVVWHVRDYVSCRPLMSQLMRRHAGGCAMALTNSRSVANDLDDVCRHKLRITTVYNAVDLERFNPKGPVLDLDEACGLPRGPAGLLRVGLVATTARWKGQDIFLRAIARLPTGTIRAYMIGGPIYETDGSQYTLEELRGLACALHVERRVGFTGFLKDPAAGFRALDIVVHASTRSEPFGRVVAEAMACGKPVVVSQTGGVAEIILENENALTYQPGDAVTMAARIERLAADPSLRHKLGTEARRWAEQRFDLSRLAAEVVPIYQSLAPVSPPMPVTSPLAHQGL